MRIQANGKVLRGRFLALLLSISIGIVLAGGILALFALILTKHELDERWHFSILCAAVCLGGILSSFVFAKKVKMKGIAAGLVCGMLYAGAMYLVLSFSLRTGGSVKLFILLAISFLLSVLSGIAARNI